MEPVKEKEAEKVVVSTEKVVVATEKVVVSTEKAGVATEKAVVSTEKVETEKVVKVKTAEIVEKNGIEEEKSDFVKPIKEEGKFV